MDDDLTAPRVPFTREEYDALSDAELRDLNDAQWGKVAGSWDPKPETGTAHGARSIARSNDQSECPRCTYRLAPGQTTVDCDDGVRVHTACWRDWVIQTLDAA